MYSNTYHKHIPYTHTHTHTHTGLKTLPDVYRDLVELPVDYSKYKQWASKPLPANARASAHILQYIPYTPSTIACSLPLASQRDP